LSKGVWVFVEQKEGELSEDSLEVISEGRRLADQLQEELSAILLGYQVDGLAKTLAHYGAERVYLAENEGLIQYNPDAYTAILAGLIKEHEPSIFLLGATTLGEDLAPRVAGSVKTGLASNCDKLQISEGGLLLQTRLCYESKVHATVVCPKAKPQMATVQPGVMKIDPPDESRNTTIIRVSLNSYIKPEAVRTKIVGFIKGDPKTIDLTEAELIVAGGKGVNDKESFQLIWELANHLGASVGGTRMAVDSGWIGSERQIGQTGKTVSPKVIISCGISGASAHIFGMKDSKTVIAINIDQDAPIFKLADLGVVGDLHQIIPALINYLSEVSRRESDDDK
jgi:electron transfer flavoprotein alpha subunit